ncbi:MAG: dTDP-4-dehydrorhamnose reductase [Candidatus Gracilibacteria bacterium]|nr:dTDP-4-dehydrorhamnose reductase [Candidatus Gracilibacteria bacterium]
MKRILLTGAKGMLAHDFMESQKERFEIIPFDRDYLDITDIQQVEQRVQESQADIILNCAAYTNVDGAEDTGKKMNLDINVLGVFNLAKIANRQNIDFITLSTDYVFDGTKEGGYNENDEQNPINNYGLAKYLGEKLACEVNPQSIIVRTSWLYGGGNEHKNFVNTMLKLSETRNELRVINDQFGSPTYVMDLSQALGDIIGNIDTFRGKILHLSNETSNNGITWFDFASEIFKMADRKINLTPCTTEEYQTKAVRPKFSKMNNNSSVQMRNWKEGLREYLSKP